MKYVSSTLCPTMLIRPWLCISSIRSVCFRMARSLPCVACKLTSFIVTLLTNSVGCLMVCFTPSLVTTWILPSGASSMHSLSVTVQYLLPLLPHNPMNLCCIDLYTFCTTFSNTRQELPHSASAPMICWSAFTNTCVGMSKACCRALVTLCFASVPDFNKYSTTSNV